MAAAMNVHGWCIQSQQRLELVGVDTRINAILSVMATVHAHGDDGTFVTCCHSLFAPSIMTEKSVFFPL
jgi:hypothetical protein